ncbi:low-specificity L-threonine aldolase [Ferrimonas sediminicola]|uniref:Low-specificity L-threonine aldolase n=1 Tax=Ferrimonas sediminicola TaxID=2569538 RepID=A0A4U1BCL2_9GAMM|nr:low-specificity L-threonine aldolase [Ferrimonas sediminicola]TKB48763.1 low-specificity L-threonine aldolase [Ferrimonas sediminicola]
MIDFRSDTVTRPSDQMRRIMADAQVGDDVYGDDPSVNRLEEYAADLAGFEAALFTSSGTQANLLALMSHCQRGDEYLCGQQAHNYRFEGGGAAVLGSIQPQPVENDADGSLPLEKLAAQIKPDDIHFAQTRLLSLENTIGGKVLSQDYLAQAQGFAFEHGLKIHLDGARVFNASVRQQLPLSAIAQHFDSLTICLSKGLGAPVGSLLVGDEALITKARRWRKMLGGGLRQAGILAAAGQYALENNVNRLAEDHDNAGYLASELAQLDELEVALEQVQTNMVFARLSSGDSRALQHHLAQRGILISAANTLRLVTHLDVDRTGVDKLITETKAFFASNR